MSFLRNIHVHVHCSCGVKNSLSAFVPRLMFNWNASHLMCFHSYDNPLNVYFEENTLNQYHLTLVKYTDKVQTGKIEFNSKYFHRNGKLFHSINVYP